MTIKTVIALPVDLKLAGRIQEWLAVSNDSGEPLSGRSAEWVLAAQKVAEGVKLALRNDGIVELG